MPSYKDGRVSLADLAPVHVPGYRLLFTEKQDYLRKLGTLDEANASDPQLLVPNYIASQALCLTTASYYTVCCPSRCDDIVAKLERAATAQSVTPQQITDVLAEGGAGHALTEVERSALDALSVNGSVALHGRALAGWLHSVFLADCPMPMEHDNANPKTADEWMADPGTNVQDTEELMLEISETLVRYTTLGLEGVDEATKQEEAAEVMDDTVEVIVDPSSRQLQESQEESVMTSYRRFGLGSLFQIAASFSLLASMLVLCLAMIRAVMSAQGINGPKWL
mmetsp:Transcript_49258/g.124043  ORF Transcript_49258/g.124043 Transcript_49258/m.124043 type:complete len:281 (+) Transcript_49258:2-844(+)